MELQEVKRRFGIIGNNEQLNRALNVAMQIAPTDISALVVGESGVGKEFIPKIIHQLSNRKHNEYIAVNCGAIPEGTIDSELFGHEKGSFTGASGTRKGYFEVADGGTIFLDEVGELPLQTQVRLLRVLESGEFMKVGSSNIQKTDVRIVAATNVNMEDAIKKGRFREDLYYRLDTVTITLPPLRERKEDIPLLFRKFANDFSEKYNVPPIELDSGATEYIKRYPWPGNVRQLRNFAEEISVVETKRLLSEDQIKVYLPPVSQNTSLMITGKGDATESMTEREILYKVLFDMRSDIQDLKKLTLELMEGEDASQVAKENKGIIQRVFSDMNEPLESMPKNLPPYQHTLDEAMDSSEEILDYQDIEEVEEEKESLSLQDKEVELIKKALDKNNGRRKEAAQELGISERTLYRKIKQYELQ